MFFNSGFFWFVMGILMTVAFLGARAWFQDKHIAMPWWKWLLVALWALLLAFTLGWVGTSIGENEVKAAGVGGAIFGVLTIILGVGLWRVLLLKRKSA